MAKQIFLLYSCSEWDRNSSLIYAGTSERKLKKVIENEIREKNMIYNDDELSVSKQIAAFKSDWKKRDRRWINNQLQYGFYDYTDNDTMI